MNHSVIEEQTCCSVNKSVDVKPRGGLLKAKKTAASVSSVALSVLIAFFPKCAACWAVYMSMFGSIGLVQLPYMGWMLPVLIGFLCLHLFILYKRADIVGYTPFVLSLIGAAIILAARNSFPSQRWLLLTGMFLIISGSLINTLSPRFSQYFSTKKSR